MIKILKLIILGTMTVTMLSGCGKKQTMVLTDDVAMSQSRTALTECVKLVDEGREDEAKSYLNSRQVILYGNDEEEISVEKELESTKEGKMAKFTMHI